jgi:transcriptional regulator with XRE-family HTH domain
MPTTPYESNRARHWACALQIAERRRQLGLTQQDVVDRLAALGVSATNRTLSAMEHGQGIDVGRIPELAIALECTVTYLLGLTTHPQRWMPDDGSLPNALLAARAHGPTRGAWQHGVWHADGGRSHDGEWVAHAHLAANPPTALHRFPDRVAAVEDEIPARATRIRRA